MAMTGNVVQLLEGEEKGQRQKQKKKRWNVNVRLYSPVMRH